MEFQNAEMPDSPAILNMEIIAIKQLARSSLPLAPQEGSFDNRQ
jgi:hypothetical protein